MINHNFMIVDEQIIHSH